MTTDDATTTRVTRVRAWRGRLEWVADHLARLGATVTAAHVAERLHAAHAASGRRDGILELRRSMAAGGSAAVEIAPLRDPPFDGERLAEGLTLRTAGERPPLAPPKTLAAVRQADALLAQARAHGADELLWHGADGAVLGATAMNLFLVRGTTLLTPSLGSGAWPGLLRRAVLQAARDVAPGLALSVREERLLASDLAGADDAFLAAAAHGLVAIRAIDGRVLPAPPRGSPARALVPKLKLRLHELCGAEPLPPK
ncbi:MAG: hypothetical protein FJ293_09355 [Planctomycetes bacterium]|nr:hypothetical protein [Planctomycetota bacterium]